MNIHPSFLRVFQRTLAKMSFLDIVILVWTAWRVSRRFHEASIELETQGVQS